MYLSFNQVAESYQYTVIMVEIIHQPRLVYGYVIQKVEGKIVTP